MNTPPPSPPSSRFLLSSTNWLWLVMACVVVAWVHADADPDLWHRLAVGGVWAATGGVLPSDVFSYTPTLPVWIDHEWGSGVLFWLLAEVGGPGALFALKLLLLGGVMACVVVASRVRFRSFPTWNLSFFLIVLLAVAPGFTTTIRCQAFTFFFFAAFLLVLETWRRKRSPWVLAWLPAMMLVWANGHGGYLAGLGIIGLYAAGEFLNRKPICWLIAAGIAATAITVVNPYGLGMWSNVTDAVSRARPYMAEWESLLTAGGPWAFLGGKVLVGLTLLGALPLISHLRQGRADFVVLLALGFTLYLGVKHVRHLPLFAITAGLFLPPLLTAYVVGWRRARKAMPHWSMRLASAITRMLLPAFFFFGFLSLVTERAPVLRVTNAEYATGAIDFIRRNNISGKLVVPFNHASYAFYKLFPACRVNIDGRFEQVYPVEVFDAATAFQFNEPGGEALLTLYPPDIIIASVCRGPIDTLRASAQWRIVYEDNVAVVLLPTQSRFPLQDNRPAILPTAAQALDTADFLRRWQSYEADAERKANIAPF